MERNSLLSRYEQMRRSAPADRVVLRDPCGKGASEMGDILNWSNLLGGAIGGIATWLFVDFVTRPLRQFYQMRAEIFERIQYYGNLPTHEPGASLETGEAERAIEAMNALRQLSTRIMSFAATEAPAVWLLRQRGHDPMQAGRSLIGYSNTIMTQGGERAIHRKKVLTALRIDEN
jgi:hypothetical protein